MWQLGSSLDTERQPVPREDHRRELGQRRRHPVSISRQAMRDQADLTPTGQPGIAIQPQNAAGYAVADLAVRHVSSDMAFKRQVPQGQDGDVHGSGPGMKQLPAR